MDIQERQQRVHEVCTMREDGMSWNDIAKRFGHKSGEVARQNHHHMNNRLQRHLEERGIDPADVRMVWDKTKEYSVKTVYDNTYTPEQVVEKLDSLLQDKYGNIPLKEAVKIPHGNLLVVDPADVHLGKLATKKGDLYNLPIAIARAKEGVEGIIQKSKGFEPKQVVLVMGNDILHIDTPRRTTTSGTPQDTDGMWHDAFDAAIRFYVQVIDWLKGVANVHAVYCPSNHDYMSGYMLAKCIQAWFRNDERVTFDVSISPRKYYKHGKTLLGLAHGDGAKEGEFPLLMAQESRKMWAGSEYCYWLLHHVHHHKKVKWLDAEDYIGATVTYLRSPSGTDRWHDTQGYIGGKCAVEGFVYSDKTGQCCHLTHNF